MKKATLLVLIGLFFLPSIASAAWWNPFTWKIAPKATEISTTSASTSTVDTSLLPTTDDLYKRIAELEMKLDDARAKLKAAGIPYNSEVKIATTTAPVAYNGFSDKSLIAKIKPSMVLVETATSSVGGPIIDSQGHILIRAHGVWIQDSSGNVIGAVPQATVTLSTGVKKTANLVGIDEANDLAVMQLSDGRSSSYVPLNYDYGLSLGDKVYVFGFPSAQSNGGTSFASGDIVQKTSSSIQITMGSKTFDNGGAMITKSGGLVGIPNPPTCIVLEEMSTCLKYKVTSNIYRSAIPKLLQGMKLYKNKQNKTPEDILMRGYLDGLYNSVNQSSIVSFAVNNVTGPNSFDYLNSKLVNDTEDRVAKIYIIKMKAAADNLNQAFDFLKSASYALHVSLINDDKSILELDGYEQKILRGIQSDNDVRLKDYEARVDFWSKKKNEYDSYLTNPSSASHDYLMAEGASIETAAEYLQNERQKIIDSLSSDIINLF